MKCLCLNLYAPVSHLSIVCHIILNKINYIKNGIIHHNKEVLSFNFIDKFPNSRISLLLL